MVRSNIYIIAILIVAFSLLTIGSCAQNKKKGEMKEQKVTMQNMGYITKNKEEQMACKLTTPELRKRKETVIASLKQQILDKKELANGYAFKFPGTDSILDKLTEFIKTERECCSFFIFTICASGDKSEAWLELTGADGAKEFITTELGL